MAQVLARTLVQAGSKCEFSSCRLPRRRVRQVEALGLHSVVLPNSQVQERNGKERKERNGKEKKGRERKGKERKVPISPTYPKASCEFSM